MSNLINQHREAFNNSLIVKGDEEFYEDFGDLLMVPNVIKDFKESRVFSQTNDTWGKMNLKLAYVSGSMMTVMDNYDPEVTKTPTLSDFYGEYKSRYEDTNHPFSGGYEFKDKKTGEGFVDYFTRHCQRWADVHPFYQGDMTVAVTEWFIHLVVQSYEGYLTERIAQVWLNENLDAFKEYAGFNADDELEVRHSPERLDQFYNSDLVVLKNGELLFSVQVKPRSYFHKTDPTRSTFAAAMYKDKTANIMKDIKLLQDYGINQYYIDRDNIMLLDYPPELISYKSVMIDKTAEEMWMSIRQQEDGSFRRIKEHRRTPPQYLRFPY